MDLVNPVMLLPTYLIGGPGPMPENILQGRLVLLRIPAIPLVALALSSIGLAMTNVPAKLRRPVMVGTLPTVLCLKHVARPKTTWHITGISSPSQRSNRRLVYLPSGLMAF